MFVTQAEFSRLAGVSRSAVKQAIDNRLITATTEQAGKILINKTEGLAQYRANSRKQRKTTEAKKAQPPPSQNELGALSWGQGSTTEQTPSQQHQPTRTVRVAESDVPDYNEERARHEREKRMLAELARQEKERELLRRDDVTAAWAAAVAMTRTKLLGVPSVVRARIPHLEIDEVEVITQLIREALEELAAGEVQA
jgi:hypothetical protein